MGGQSVTWIDQESLLLHQRRFDLEKLLAFVFAAYVIVRLFVHIRAAWSFTTDDAYITLRYARHLAEGHGIVWNVDEPVPVEGYSNFLFVVLGAIALWLGLDAVLCLKGLCVAALLGTCFLLHRLTRLWLGPVLSVIPALFLIAYRGTSWWTVSGLETAVYQLLVVGAVTACIVGLGFKPVGSPAGQLEAGPDPNALRYSSRLLALAGFLIFLLSITRPEGPLILVALMAGMVVHVGARLWRYYRLGDRNGLARLLRESVKATALPIGCFALPFAAYFAWRYQYFGRVFPNTVYCKSGFLEDPFRLNREFWNVAKPFVLLSLIQRPGRFDARHAILWSVPLLYAAILHGADPVIAHYLRHYLAAFALLLVTAAVGFSNLFRLLVPVALFGVELLLELEEQLARLVRKHLPSIQSLYGLVQLPARGLRHLHRLSRLTAVQHALIAFIALSWVGVDGTWMDRTMQSESLRYSVRMKVREEVSAYLNAHLSSEDLFLIGDAGLVPFLTRTRVLDAFCLNSIEMTTPPINMSPERFVDMIFQRMPKMLITSTRSDDELALSRLLNVQPVLLQHPEFQRRYQLAKRMGSKSARIYYWLYERRPAPE